MKPILLKITTGFCWLLLLLLTTSNLKAQSGKGIVLKTVLDGAKGQLVKDSVVALQDSVYFDASLTSKLDTPYYLRNIVTFKINEYASIYLPASFSATVKIRIYYTRPDNVLDSAADQQLTINYDTSHPYQSRNSFVFNNAHKVQVKVLELTTNAGKDISAALMLENEMEVRPVFKLSKTADAVQTITSNHPDNTDSTDEISVRWDGVIGADVYDLEWAYIDSSALEVRRYGNPLDPELIFANNTTRVTVAGTSYAIPLLYDKVGVLYFRVRAVQEKANDVRKETIWSNIDFYNFDGHQRKLNWQSTISYAEDGKRKVVVQYYDGSLRSRQTVTKDNITNNIIAGESFYDYQGRPVIQVLPVPTLNNVLKYTRNLNSAMNGAEYDKDNYDYLEKPADYLTVAARPLSDTSGASKYYSSKNPDKNTSIGQYIPDAGGYPFTETEFAPDNTGHVSRQSGVGPDFRLGSGHETKYSYGITPSQEDLDALFGTEVGINSHYFKNSVIDPNGQISVSYLDMHGRTIATALAGKAENKALQDLPSKVGLTVTEALSGQDNNTVRDWALESYYSFQVTDDSTTYDFKYDLTPPVLRRKNCKDSVISYPGVYNLRIRLTDDVYGQHLGGQPFDTVIHSMGTGPVTLSFSKLLLRGAYQITKSLEVDKAMMDYYRDSIFLQSNVCVTVEKMIEDQLIKGRSVSCYPSCGTCEVGRTEQDDIRKVMLSDVTPPSGQYANYADSNSVYSIFYNHGVAYKDPAIIYRDEKGVRDSVYSILFGRKVLPQDLNVEEFTNAFKNSWAEALLDKHPEHNKLFYYGLLDASLQWDKDFATTDTYAAAKQKGYLNPFGNQPRFPNGTNDPITVADVLNPLKLKADNMQEGYSMWSLATTIVKCPERNTTCAPNYKPISMTFDESNTCPGDLDMAWRSFRGFYQNEKRTRISIWLDAKDAAATADILRRAGKMPRFNTPQNAASQAGLPGNFNDTAAAVSNTKAQMDALYEDNCRSYVNSWMAKLAPCQYYDSTAFAEIIPKLITVCKGGADIDHPYGSSTLKTGLKGTFSSFDEVLQDYNRRNNITDTYNCNGYMITVPQAYDMQPALGNSYSFIKPTDCQCGKLRALEIEYREQKKDDINLSAYLKRTRQVTITQENLNALIDACNNASNACHYLAKAVDIPALLACNAAPACVPCQVTDSLYSAYKSLYPSALPKLPIADSLQEKKNKLFAAFMNSKLGYRKEAYDYLQFIDSCGKKQTGPGRTVCQTGPADSKKMISSYSNGGIDVMTAICNTADNGYIMAGYTTGCTSGGKDGYVIRTDSKGNLLWAKTYGGAQDDQFNRLIPSRDGGFIAVGTTFSNCYDQGAILVVKLDSTGQVSWNKAIDFDAQHGGRGSDVIETSEGDLAFAGLRTGNGVFSDWVTGVFSSTGDMKWMKQAGSAVNRDIIRLAEKSDTLVAATSIMEGAAFDAVLLKINKNTGDILESAQYDLEGRGNIVSNIFNTTTGYKLTIANLVDGNNASVSPVLMDLTTAGNIKSVIKVGSPVAINPSTAKVFWVTAATADGGVIGSQSTTDAYWYKLDADNIPTWANHVNINASEWLTSLVQNRIGSYAGTGLYNNHAMLMQANAQGKTGCSSIEEQISGSDITAACIRRVLATQTIVSLGTNNISAMAMNEKLCNPVVTTENCGGLDTCFQIYDSPLLCGNAESAYQDISLPDISSCSDSTIFADAKGMEFYNAYRDSVLNDFDTAYINTTLSVVKQEQFIVTHAGSEYHYTLYYYDQAGNLVKTVPPNGVAKNRSKAWTDSVAVARAAGLVALPRHSMETNYRYNTLNQIVGQASPDGRASHFWYDRLGRLAVSQNRKQEFNNAYSYTLYDYLGRITEVGEISSSTPMSSDISRNAIALSQWVNTSGSSRSQITRTTYDLPSTFLEQDIWQAKNLRNRVSWSAVYDHIADTVPGGQASATYYSYDIHGNVRTLLQDYSANTPNPGNRFKKMEYNYDLVSGKVNSVSYQPGQRDAFYHRYSYDAENRITNVETSRDSIYWENDAYYQYYKHGPLARAVIGQQQVQGLDYAYTLQGWLKGVNSTTATSTFDIGKDGAKNGITAQDAFGFALHYFGDNDYKPINSDARPFASAGGTLPSLYNGNISAMSVNIPKVGPPLMYSYTYDALNRLATMNTAHNLNTTTNTWTPINVSDFGEKISYDPNGNILTYDRHGNSTWAGKSLSMDSMRYHYEPGMNRLQSISDDAPTTAYDNDIDGQVSNNYLYDSIGNLIHDTQAGIDIEWTVYGKIKQIRKADSSTIVYTYDVAGNRISKVAKGIETRYIRDASGNVMSVYVSGDQAINSGLLSQTETHLYGSSRLGINNMATQVQNDDTTQLVRLQGLGFGTFATFTRGNKFFELSNHLGNVLATVTDAKKVVSVDGNVVDHYEAEVASAQDYAPFGMGLQGRGFDAGRYRYGFNGKENDNEVKGEGNQQDYGMRIYDPRIGKFLSVDPLANEYAFYSPYQFAGNKPILFIDLDGNEVSVAPISKFKYGDNVALNAVNVVNNGAINVANGVIGLFNSTAYVGYSVFNKSPVDNLKEIKSEFQELGSNVKKAAVSQYTYATQTPWRQQVKETGADLLTADAWEQASTLAWGLAVAKMDFSVPEPPPGLVKAGFSGESRINIAKGRTRMTPLRESGSQVSAGWDHVVGGHFDVPVTANRSVFSIGTDDLKTILQSKNVVSSPVTSIEGGQYVRTVDVGRTIGTASLKQGGNPTSWIKIFTDKAGNLITTYPTAAPTPPPIP